MAMHSITLTINGEREIVSVPSQMTLLQMLREDIGDQLHFHLRYQCSPYHTASAFFPIIQRLER